MEIKEKNKKGDIDLEIHLSDGERKYIRDEFRANMSQIKGVIKSGTLIYLLRKLEKIL